MRQGANEIANKLNESVVRVVEHLLPAGKHKGSYWEVGDINGDPGKSLKVTLTGQYAGHWKDFAGVDHGDLLDMWAIIRGVDLSQAMTEAKRFLGIQENENLRITKKTWSRPKPIGVEIGKVDAAEIYLTLERKLDQNIIDAFKVTANEKEIIFPYYRGDELINQKYLAIERVNGKKQIRAEKDCEPCLFGWQALNPLARSVVICEGELDAMSLHQYGFNSLSVPFGANNLAWLESDFERLAVFDEIFICFDNDEAGQAHVNDIAARLGHYRCKVVKLPMKDANECLKNKVSVEDIKKYFNEAKSFHPKEIKRPSMLYEQTYSEVFLNEANCVGLDLPFKRTHGDVLIRPQELILWNGINGHGKSQMIGQVTLGMMRQNKQVFIASLELPAKRLMSRLTHQASGIKNMSPEYFNAIFEWMEDKLLIYDVLGTVEQNKLFESMLYARQRYGVDIFVIDSLMKCLKKDDDMNEEKAFLERLCDFKHAYDCTIHLIVHPRKGDDESSPPGKMDIKGSSMISNLADTIFSVWRNKPKEDEAKYANNDKKILTEEHYNKPDCILRCDKQRNGGEEGLYYLWYDKDSFQYLDSRYDKPLHYVNFSNQQHFN